MPCVACERLPAYQRECPECNGEGWLKLTRCPREESAGLGGELDLLEIAREGALPLAGGALDQVDSFLDALQFYKQEWRRLNPNV